MDLKRNYWLVKGKADDCLLVLVLVLADAENIEVVVEMTE